MVVVSHLFLFLGDKFRGRCDSRESHLPLFKTIYFPIAPLSGYVLFYFYNAEARAAQTADFLMLFFSPENPVFLSPAPLLP